MIFACGGKVRQVALVRV